MNSHVEILDWNIKKITDTDIKPHKAPTISDSFRVKSDVDRLYLGQTVHCTKK